MSVHIKTTLESIPLNAAQQAFCAKHAIKATRQTFGDHIFSYVTDYYTRRVGAWRVSVSGETQGPWYGSSFKASANRAGYEYTPPVKFDTLREAVAWLIRQ